MQLETLYFTFFGEFAKIQRLGKTVVLQSPLLILQHSWNYPLHQKQGA